MLTYADPLLLLFSLAALLGWLPWRRTQRRLLPLLGATGLVLLAWPPVDWLLSRPLEIWYPVRAFPTGSADAMVVLSSSIDPPHGSRPYSLPDKLTVDRCRHAAWLYKNWKPLPVLACGGLGGTRVPYSVTMRELLIQQGVPENMIWTEERSLTTYDNALQGTRVLRAHGVRKIALVLEAQSMPRAAACFRKQGIEVTPAISDFREWGPLREELLPSWRSVYRNFVTTHEIGGLIWYRLRGRI